MARRSLSEPFARTSASRNGFFVLRRATWLYPGGAAVVLDRHGLIVRLTHVRVIHGEDLGARMTHANCSQAMDDCIVYLTNGRRFRCQGANQHEVDDQISSIIIGRRCTTVG